MRAGNSYASSSEPRVTFGVGNASEVDALDVRWPSGLEQSFQKLPVNVWVSLTEGDPVPRIETRRGP